MLTNYDPTLNISPEEAKQDRIELELGDWFVTAAQPLLFFGALASQRDEEHRPLFNRPRGRDPTSPILYVNAGGRGTGERQGAPLFQGALHAKRMGRDPSHGGDVRRLSLRISINPTRFVAHNVSRALAVRPFDEWELPPANMVRRTVVLATARETSLDLNDNILLSQVAQAFGRPEAWAQHLQRYWHGLIDQIGREFANAAATANAALEFRPSLNLQTAQTYWEFEHPDPTDIVVKLQPILFQFGLRAELRNYSYTHGEASAALEGNSWSLTIRLRSGVRLRVYAKTTRRVRFEIEHNLIENARPLNGRHADRDLGTMTVWLNALAIDAAQELQAVFEHIATQTFFQPDSLSPVQLVRRVIASCPNDVEADTLLSLIVNSNSVRLRQRDPLRTSVHLLTSQGVLERLGRRGSYVVTGQFQQAVAELRGQRRLKLRGQVFRGPGTPSV